MPKRATRSATRPTAAKLRLMLVDDHPVWRSAIKEILEQKRVGAVVAEASDGAEVLAVATRAKPDVVVMDMGLPGLDGAEATRQLVSHSPEIKVLVLSASDREDDVLHAIRAGASGYLLKSAASAEIVDAIGRVRGGELVLPPALAEVVLRELREGSGAARRRRVIVADPSSVSRDGLARVLAENGFDVVASAKDEAGLFESLADDEVDVVIIDARLAPGGREHPVAAIRKTHPSVGILVLSDERDPDYAVREGAAITKGFGYALKYRIHDAGHLASMIRRVAEGEWVVDPEVAGALAAARPQGSPLEDLSTREREVLALMAEGRSNQAIGDLLKLMPKTVEAHVRHIFTKLGLEPAPDLSRRVLAVLTYLRSV